MTTALRGELPDVGRCYGGRIGYPRAAVTVLRWRRLDIPDGIRYTRLPVDPRLCLRCS